MSAELSPARCESICCSNARSNLTRIEKGESHETVPSQSSSIGALKECRLFIIGMDCAGCTGDVSRYLNSIPGVITHTVNYFSSEAVVQYEGWTTSQVIASRLRKLGQACEEISEEQILSSASKGKNTDCRELTMRLMFTLCCSISFFLNSKVARSDSMYSNQVIFHGLFTTDCIDLLVLIPLLYLSRHLYLSAYKACCRGASNVDTLVTCGIISVLLYSLASILISVRTSGAIRPERLFDTAGELTSMTFLGRYLETRVGGCAADTIRDLAECIPQDTIRLSAGVEERIASNNLASGDIVLVNRGVVFPADCRLLTTTATTDDSAISGDFLPVDKQQGDRVYAGTTNLSSVVTCEVLFKGSETHLSRVSRILSDSQANKASVQLLADHVAEVSIPSLIALSLSTFLAWLYFDPTRYTAILEQTGRVLLSLKLAVAVIVVACPCALSVATPTAVVVGTAVAARLGILMKGANVLETMAAVTDVVFDKTGTLTLGKLEVSFVQFEACKMSIEQLEDLWKALATAEIQSESLHPVSEAIVNYASRCYAFEKKSMHKVQNLEETPGHGLKCSWWSATFNKRCDLVAGNRNLLQSLDVVITDIKDCGHMATSATSIHVAVNGCLVGIVFFNDSVRLESVKVIRRLSNMHRKVWMLTGDNAAAAHMIADQVGISHEHIISDASTQRKAEIIQELQQHGSTVAFCGDGVNDVLALTTADVGISLTGATNAAMDSADVIISGTDKLHKIVTSLNLARDVLRRIKVNLLFAMAWNLITIPLAMGLFLPWHIYLSPVLACAIMSLSCISIMLSSLTIRWWKERPVALSLHMLDPENIDLLEGDRRSMEEKV